MPQNLQDNLQENVFVLDGAVRLNQPKSGGFRTSLDSVMLAAACKAAAGDHILDMGCGVGSAGLCVLARVPRARLTGVEVQADLAAIADENARLNGHAAQTAEFICSDITEFRAGAEAGIYDHVICNPPYLESGSYTPSPDNGRDIALGHHGRDMTLEDWVSAAHRLVRSRGTFTMIHRADHADRILRALGRRFGRTEIIPLWPRAGHEARRVIIRTIKDRRDPCIIHPGIILHEADGTWTPGSDDILRRMHAV